jgi:RNA polymerase sigma factor (sigma-70 family)
VVVDSIRRRNAQAHGGGAIHAGLETDIAAVNHRERDEMDAVAYAIEQLELIDARLARVVEMRFFGGMTEPEIAQALGVTERTVRRDWQKARLLLAQAIRCS